MYRRFRHAAGVVVGFLNLRRWPWPLWKLRGWGSVPVGAHEFRFYGLAAPHHAWWAFQARRGTWEPVVVRELSRALQPGDVFLDLGAYIGPFTLLASRLVGPEGRVVAFEPDPATRAILERNLAANGAGNVIVAPYAVGDRDGRVSFVASGDSVGHIGADGDLEVEQVTLDGYCARHGLTPTVAKVDIEGGEAAALSGSEAIRKVRELVLEVHEPPLRSQGVDPTSFLNGLGTHRVLESTESGNYAVLVTPGAAR